MSAHDTAQKMLSLLRPHCQRVEIAGSLRRGKADPKDTLDSILARRTG